MLFYCGSYVDDPEEQGIHILEFDEKKKSLSIVGGTKAGINPSYLLLDEQKTRLYAVNETSSASEGGAVTAFRVSPGGRFLSLLHSCPIPGKSPCHIVQSADGPFLFTADYDSGTVTVIELDDNGFPFDPEIALARQGGGRDPIRQEQPHIHSVYFKDKLLWVADLGSDIIAYYPVSGRKIHAEYSGEYKFEDGAGPRMIEFGPKQLYFAVEELSDKITAIIKEGNDFRTLYSFSASGDDWTGQNAPAHLSYFQEENALYVSNRGRESIAAFRADETGKNLDRIQDYQLKGKGPRHFAIYNRYLFIACMDSSSIECLEIENGGYLKGVCEIENVNTPSCITVFNI